MPPRSDLSMQVTCTCPDSQGSRVPPPQGALLFLQVQSQKEALPAASDFRPPCQARSPQGPPFCTPRSPLPSSPGPTPTFQAPPPVHPHPPFPSFQLLAGPVGPFFGYSECLQEPGLVLSSQEPQCLHLGRGGWARVTLVFYKVDPRGRAVVTHRAKERGTREGLERPCLEEPPQLNKWQTLQEHPSLGRGRRRSVRSPGQGPGDTARLPRSVSPSGPALSSLVQRLPPHLGRQVLASPARLLRALPAGSRRGPDRKSVV